MEMIIINYSCWEKMAHNHEFFNDLYLFWRLHLYKCQFGTCVYLSIITQETIVSQQNDVIM